MIPASFAKSLPVGQNLDPFEIYFILDKPDYKKNRGWINKINKDNSLTSGLFKIKAFPKELLYNTKEGAFVANLLKHSNVIARAIHPDQNMVHVEHQFIDVSEGITDIFKHSLYLFILQLLRANLDEVRQFRFFNSDIIGSDFEIFEDNTSLNNIEKIFDDLVDYYSSKINGKEKQRLRPYKTPPRRRLRKRDDLESRFNSKFLEFRLDFEFSDYSASEDKREILDNLEIIKDENGNYNINSENLKLLLEKGGFIIKTPKGGVNPWIEPDKISIRIMEGSGRNQVERYPILEVQMGDLVHQIQLKSKEGTILYLAILLKRKHGYILKREEVINIFKNIPQKLSREINRDNLCEYVADENMAAYEWIKGIYNSIFGEGSFNQWCYQMYRTDYDRAFRNGLYQLKEHIRQSMYNAGYEAYTPYVNVETIKKINVKTKKKSKENDYSIKAFPHNINFSGNMEKLVTVTALYLSNVIKE